MTFFPWLDEGRGTLIDLPECPRRFLEEGRVVYLTRDELALFEVKVKEGRLVWALDGLPVTLPSPPGASLSSQRAQAAEAIIESRLAPARRREHLLATAHAQVEAAESSGAKPTSALLATILSPLVEEGLLFQLRDPFFESRLTARPSDDDLEWYQSSWISFQIHPPPATSRTGVAYAPPTELLPDLSWADVRRAIEHDQGRWMRVPFPTVDSRRGCKPGKGGIFVVDVFGKMYCGDKVTGAFHHSSMTRGHCVMFAGALTVKEGRVQMLAPYSGHYVPTEIDYDNFLQLLRSRGVSLSETDIKGMVKDG